MRNRLLLTVLMAILLGAAAPVPEPTPHQLRDYARSYASRVYRDEPIETWEHALRDTLRKDGDLAAAAMALAPAHRLSPTQMRALITLWVSARTPELVTNKPAARAELRRRFLALVRATGHAPLVVRAAAETLDTFDECSAADFGALVDRAPDRASAAWQVMSGQVCPEAMLRYLRAAPDRPAPALVRIAKYGVLGPVDALPIYAWLTSAGALARAAPDDRFTYEAAIRQRQLDTMFDAGLPERAVALFEALPAPMREAVLAKTRKGFSAALDGVPIAFDESPLGTDLRIDLAAAYALAGRKPDAEAMAAGAAAAGRRVNEADLAVLDRFLHRRDDDNFDLFERPGWGSIERRGAMTAVRCRLFAEYRRCAPDPAPEPYPAWFDLADRAESHRIGQAIAALGLPGYAEDRAPFAAALTAPPSPLSTPFFVQPPPPAFAVTSLAPGFGRSRPTYTGWPAGMTRLDEDFFPIRVEREGLRVAAISISDRYQRTTGQRPSRGDYWVHLSDDGGKSWRSYFTGLVSAYPYVILSSSNLPMLGRDTLDIEVEALADDPLPGRLYPLTRRTPDLAIHIPLAVITADANGDGLTDIAARALLLDRPRSPRGSPFVVGTSPASQCTGPLDDERQLLAMIIDAMHTGPDTSWNDPLLLVGDPAWVACIPARRKIIVYHPADVRWFGREGAYLNLRPLPGLVFNRARDRAFGGEWHARRIDGVWHLERDPPPMV